MKQGNITVVRDASTLIFVYKKRNPASATGDYFGSADVTAADIKVINTATGATILASTGMTYVAALRGYRYIWTYGANLSGVQAITVEVTPTRAVGVSATLTPIDSDEFELSDPLERIDEANVDVDALQTDFNNFETINQGEHDATQSAISQIAVAARAQLIGPTDFEIPDSGSKTFVLEFVFRDTDSSPATLTDPDGNQVDISVLNQAGSAPTGVTLAGAPAGRMTRDAQGKYSLVVTVASTAIDDTQLRFTADFVEGGLADVAKWITMLGDFDQLDTIQSQVDAIRATDVPAIQANIDAAESAVLTDASTKHTTLVAEHDATQALLEHASFGLAALKALLDAEATSLASLHTKIGTNADAAGTTTVFARLRQAIETYLADSTSGLVALNNDLDNLLARLGVTTDTGGSITAGTAMAKLNRILDTQALDTLVIVPD